MNCPFNFESKRLTKGKAYFHTFIQSERARNVYDLFSISLQGEIGFTLLSGIFLKAQ
jgi:hypothetical protein